MTDNIHNKSSANTIKKLLDYYIAQKKFEQETGDFLRSKVMYPKVYSNDLRHQYASAVTAQYLGQKPAEFLGNMHEIFYSGGQKDTAIDKYNNEIGRQYAQKYPDYTKQQYLDKLFNDNEMIKSQRIKKLGF